ncbi:MAG: flagellar hook-basal body complex protein FliE [bacterium]
MPNISALPDKLNLDLNSVSKKKAEVETPKFSETLKDMLYQVNELQNISGNETKNFITGQQGNIHEVMAAVEEAQLSFQLMLEIRNKLLESYQELMRLQV